MQLTISFFDKSLINSKENGLSLLALLSYMKIEDIQIKATFPKAEKLCRTKSIDKLFSNGKSFISYPLRVVYFTQDEPNIGAQIASILISVSKRKFKRAVKRNRVKRLIREAYRLNKEPYLRLLQKDKKRINLAFIYLKDELPSFNEIEKAIQKAAIILSDKMMKGDNV